MRIDTTARNDIVLAVVLLVLCGVVVRETLSLPESPYEPLGPAFVPQAVCIGIGALALFILARALRPLNAEVSETKTIASNEESITDQRHPVLAAAMFLITCGFVVMLQLRLVNFGLLAFIYLAGLAFLFSSAVRTRPIAILIVAALVAFGSYYVFTEIFTVDLS